MLWIYLIRTIAQLWKWASAQLIQTEPILPIECLKFEKNNRFHADLDSFYLIIEIWLIQLLNSLISIWIQSSARTKTQYVIQTILEMLNKSKFDYQATAAVRMFI